MKMQVGDEENGETNQEYAEETSMADYFDKEDALMKDHSTANPFSSTLRNESLASSRLSRLSNYSKLETITEEENALLEQDSVSPTPQTSQHLTVVTKDENEMNSNEKPSQMGFLSITRKKVVQNSPTNSIHSRLSAPVQNREPRSQSLYSNNPFRDSSHPISSEPRRPVSIQGSSYNPTKATSVVFIGSQSKYKGKSGTERQDMSSGGSLADRSNGTKSFRPFEPSKISTQRQVVSSPSERQSSGLLGQRHSITSRERQPTISPNQRHSITSPEKQPITSPNQPPSIPIHSQRPSVPVTKPRSSISIVSQRQSMPVIRGSYSTSIKPRASIQTRKSDIAISEKMEENAQKRVEELSRENVRLRNELTAVKNDLYNAQLRIKELEKELKQRNFSRQR